MKIEAGKYYITRDGRKVGPMCVYEDLDNIFHVKTGVGSVEHWDNNGVHGEGIYAYQPNLDLVAEWKDEPTTSGPTLSGDTIDLIAIDSLKWHYNEGKNDMEPLQKEAFKIVLRYYGVNL